jgi:serine/threonine protein kinase
MTITPHPRILAFNGLVDGGAYLELQYHPNGDLLSYLWEKRPPLATRINWAVEIAEGLAHIHSKKVIWADAHFRNVLVTEDLHVVLADFAYSVMDSNTFHLFTTLPPPVYACPDFYIGSRSTYVDIFGFGVMLFALLMNRFPWTDDLNPELTKQVQTMSLHQAGSFDTLDDPELKTAFAPILDKCFYPRFADGSELLSELKQAREVWLQSKPVLSVCALYISCY